MARSTKVSKSKHSTAGKKESAPPRGPTRPPRPAPPPVRRYLARCTFVGEDKKVRVEGSFRFMADAVDTAAFLPKLEKAVKKLRRSGDLPPKCDVYVEFVIELAALERGVVADFERWQRDPRQFQTGWITLSDACGVHDHGLPSFHFGKAADPAPAAS
jgi:hypothetical protein